MTALAMEYALIKATESLFASALRDGAARHAMSKSFARTNALCMEFA